MQLKAISARSTALTGKPTEAGRSAAILRARRARPEVAKKSDFEDVDRACVLESTDVLTLYWERNIAASPAGLSIQTPASPASFLTGVAGNP